MNDSESASFDELKDRYESGEVDWDDIETPESETKNEKIDMNIETNPELEENNFDPKDRFNELKDKYESNQNNNDPFVYLKQSDLKSYNDNKNRKKKNLTIPFSSSFSSEYLIMEWLQYLVDKSTTTDAYIAINYYNKVGWLEDKETEILQDYLFGFGEINKNHIDRTTTRELNKKHHKASRKYIHIIKTRNSEVIMANRLF